MTNKIQHRRDTAANWTSVNPVLSAGEPAFETDTGKQKIGNGSTAWISLAYTGSGGGLGSVVLTGTPTAGQVPTASNGTTAVWATPTGGTGAVSSVAGRTGVVSLTKTDVGLGAVQNVDATSRSNHIGTQLAATISDLATAVPVQSVSGKTGVVALVKADIGLGLVDNTADTAKPVSTATTTAIASAVVTAEARANHTGTQLAATISDFSSAADARIAAAGSSGIPQAIVDAKGDLLVGTADNTIARLAVGVSGQVLIADSTKTSGLGYVDGVKLAIAGQTPSQAPLAPGSSSVGSMAIASRADHIHPTPTGMGLAGFGMLPPNYIQNYVLDGTQTYQLNNVYRNLQFANFAGIIDVVGSTPKMTAGTFILNCQDLTIAAGITLSASLVGRGIIIISSGTVTINGSINVNGESPAIGAAPAQPGFAATFLAGSGGGAGGLNAGSAAPTPTPNDHPNVVGGIGGLGGVSGANAAGAAINWAFALPNQMIPSGAIYLLNGVTSASGPSFCGMGGGGSGGGGDGTNKGGSGGGGAGGIVIVAKSIVLGSTAVLSACGGNGANGAGGNAAGGGGGGGGAVALHSYSLTADPAARILTTAGSGGLGIGSGANGAAGLQGGLFDPPAPPTSFGHGYGAGVVVGIWQ